MRETMRPVPFHDPDITEAELKAVEQVLRSGWLTTGMVAEAFETEFAAAVGAGAAVALSSCTAALHVALCLRDLGPEDEIIVPTLTFTATAAVVPQAGARLVLADIDPRTGNLDLAAADRLVRDGRTRGVIWVHFGGNPTGFAECLTWATSRGLWVLEDAAHALSARIGGIPVGGLTTQAAFSFYPTKPLTTGEGGMLTFPEGTDPAIIARARRLTLHGIDQDAYQRSRRGVYHYEVLEDGYKYNLPDVLAAIGRAQLPRWQQARLARSAIARCYTEAFRQIPGIRLLEVDPHVESAWHLYVIGVPDALPRDAVAEQLRAREVRASVHYRPLHLHRYYRDLWFSSARGGEIQPRFPGAEDFYRTCLSLPIFVGMTAVDVDRVVDAVRDVCAGGGR